uniref:Uncharacterized protein n=1 Tax=Latimeria chalumnae TaxID=7897 RepID=H3AH91_LATCH
QGVCFHKLVYEALLRIAWKDFYSWLEEHHLEDTPKLHDNTYHDTLDAVLQYPSCTQILQLFSKYLNLLRHGSGQLAAFWMSYIDLVEILLGLLCASREGNWLLHLHFIRSIIPWCFAYDKQNYVRYLSVYYAQMTRLPDGHPDIHEHFQNGGFSVQEQREKLGGKVMYVTCEERCFRLIQENTEEVDDLKTTQEEANTCILLHAKHAAADYKSIVVADDTDVLVLCLAFNQYIDCNMYIRCSTNIRIRLIDVSKLATAIGHGAYTALIGMHSYTGCDTVSAVTAFAGHGKLSALKLLCGNRKFQDAFTNLGQQWFKCSRCFKNSIIIIIIIITRSSICDVNELRYQLFRVKKLPPCEDCIHLPALRANYQAGI